MFQTFEDDPKLKREREPGMRIKYKENVREKKEVSKRESSMKEREWM